jgi:hypothetical protein
MHARQWSVKGFQYIASSVRLIIWTHLCRELNLTRPQAETALAIEIGDKNVSRWFYARWFFIVSGRKDSLSLSKSESDQRTFDELLKDVEPLFENMCVGVSVHIRLRKRIQ